MAEAAAHSRRVERLRGRRAVSALFERGTAGRSACVVVRYLAEARDPPRAAAIAPNRLGGAVVRNRARRRVRAALRALAGELPPGTYAVIARRKALDAPFPELVDSLRAAVRRACGARERS